KQIAAVQAATESAVEGGHHMGAMIDEINSFTETLAAATEEQNAATREIARKMKQSSDAAREIALQITSISKEAEITHENAKTMLGQANGVKTDIESLNEVLVDIVRSSTT